jgi:LmbE family N-acetylglucosaminyl deacetylase
MTSTRWPRSTAPTPLERSWSTVHHRAEALHLPAIPTLVVAPHPDDEVLMAGGLIASQRTRAVDVHVLAVTDGEAAYDVADPTSLASRRRSEQLAALAELGVRPDAVTRLGLPDGAVADHVDEVADAVAGLGRFGLVIAPWTGDHHCDHEATGAAVRQGASRTGAALLFGLFWTWHHHGPADLARERLMVLELGDDVRLRRSRALRCHRSQFSCEDGPAQLTAELAEPAAWPAEYFIAPHPVAGGRADPSGPSHRLLTGVPPVTSGPSEVQT